MQLTKKDRDAILLSLKEITQQEAETIAAVNSVGPVTVYKYWKLIREGDPVEVNNITLSIAELALAKRKEEIEVEKRITEITKQLSPGKRRVAA
jgi:hypothetical protein